MADLFGVDMIKTSPPRRQGEGTAMEKTASALRAGKIIDLVVVKTLLLLLLTPTATPTTPNTLNTNLQFRLLLNTTAASGAHSVQIAKDPRNNQLYYLKL